MSIGSSDLGWVLWMIGGFLLVIAGVAGVVIWISRRRGSRSGAIDAALTIAGLWVALATIATPFGLIQTLTADNVYVTDLPISTTWPAALPCSGEATAVGPHLECASLSAADAWIVGLTIAPRLLLALGQLLASILITVPAAIIAVVCFQMLRGAPFTRVVSRSFFVAAGAVLVAGIGVDIAFGIGRGLAAAEALPPSGEGTVTASGAVFSLTVQLWPFGAALALVALTAVFRYGARLERDTVGLV